MMAVGLCACQPGAFDDLARGSGADTSGSDPTSNDGGGRLDAGGSSGTDPGAPTPAPDSGATDARADGALPDSGPSGDAAACVDMSQQPPCAVCPAGFDDCDSDLTPGPEGNGCETDLRSDHQNCSSCGLRCVPPQYGIASCDDGVCFKHTIAVLDRARGPVHGEVTGGGVFVLECPGDQVLIGAHGEYDGILYSVGATCAHLMPARSEAGLTLELSAGAILPASGAKNLAEDIETKAFNIQCPPGAVVTQVRGATAALSTGASAIVKIELTCRDVTLSEAMEVSLGSVVAEPAVSGSFKVAATFSGDCELPVVTGIAGRSGAWLDALSVPCGAPSVASSRGTTTR